MRVCGYIAQGMNLELTDYVKLLAGRQLKTSGIFYALTHDIYPIRRETR